MTDNFQPSLDLVLKSEGGFVQDPQDHGGATNLGVTAKAWSEYLGREVTIKEMKELTPLMVRPFYKDKYWNPAGCDSFAKGIDYAVFDFAVNAGVRRCIKTLQKSVGADADGILGSITQALIRQHDPIGLLDKFSEEKIKFYQSLNQPRFEKGWLNRVEEVKKNAARMISNA